MEDNKMVSKLTDEEKEILNDETVRSLYEKKYIVPNTLLYQLLVAKNSRWGEEIKEAKVLREKNAKYTSLLDIFEQRGVIPKSAILEAWKLIGEKLISLYPELASRLILEASEADIDVIEGEFCVFQDKERRVKPFYNIDLKYLFEEIDSPPMVLVTKSYYETLIVDKSRYTKGHNNDFTMLDIIKDANSKNASDIHFKFGSFYTVHFRIYGILVEQKKYTMNEERYTTLVQQIFQKITKDTGKGFEPNEFDIGQSGSLKYDSLQLDGRVESIPQGFDKKVALVIRVIKRGGSVGTIKDLNGYDEEFKELLYDLTWATSGLIIIAGVTSSGKSWLESHILMSISKEKAVYQISDPIEYKLDRSHIIQSQMFEQRGSDGKVVKKMDGEDYVRSYKRGDPDVTSVGELRKTENDSLAKAISESVKAGNLSTSTVHINSAFDVPKSLVTEFGMDINSASDILRMIINQVLVQKLCPHCKIEDTQGENRKILEGYQKRKAIGYKWQKDLDEFLKDKDAKTYLKNPKGCRHCDYKGISGLTPIYEYLHYNVDVSTKMGSDYMKYSKYDIEWMFCSLEDKYIAVNKLTTFIRMLRKGDVDTSMDTISRVLF